MPVPVDAAGLAGTGRLVSGRPSAGRLSAPVSQPRAARAIETASTAAAPARCRSCQPGGAFNRALTMPREAVATTRATSAAASARAPDGTDQCRQACTAKVSSAVPASTATARWIRFRATIPPGWPDGQSGKLAQAFSASALTTNEPETNNTPAALMAVQPSLPSRRPVVGRKGTRAATAVIVAPASMARAASRCAPTVAAHLLAALAMLAGATITAVAALVPLRPTTGRRLGRLGWTAISAAGVLFVSGSLVVNAEAEKACASFPLCPSGQPGGMVALNLIHRAVAVLAGTALLTFAVHAWRHWSVPSGTRALAAALVALVVATASLGIVSALLKAPPGWQDLHLAGAAAVL